MLREVWPLLFVRDLPRALAHYRDALGFALVGLDAEREADATWCRLQRDGASLMLQRLEKKEQLAPPSARGIAVYFLCDDVDALHAELGARGFALAPPRDAPYGMRQLELRDPDGHALCFETPLASWRG